MSNEDDPPSDESSSARQQPTRQQPTPTAGEQYHALTAQMLARREEPGWDRDMDTPIMEDLDDLWWRMTSEDRAEAGERSKLWNLERLRKLWREAQAKGTTPWSTRDEELIAGCYLEWAEGSLEKALRALWSHTHSKLLSTPNFPGCYNAWERLHRLRPRMANVAEYDREIEPLRITPHMGPETVGGILRELERMGLLIRWWVPGMLTEYDTGYDTDRERVDDGDRVLSNREPALEDPATRGCLLQQLRQATGDYTISTGYNSDGGRRTRLVWTCTGESGLFRGEALGERAASEEAAIAGALARVLAIERCYRAGGITAAKLENGG